MSLPTTQTALVAQAYNPDLAAQNKVVTDAPVPQAKAGQVLVKVHAASVNPVDWKLLAGYLDSMLPIKDFPYTTGYDIAGTVAALGDGVTGFSVGQAVFGNIGVAESVPDTNQASAGGFAQYATINATHLVAKPASISFAEAAAVPLAAATSYQMIHGDTFAKIPTQNATDSKVLVLNGGGGTGLAALQILSAAGVGTIATTASERNAANVKSAGATQVIDYKKDNWSEVLAGKDFDAVIDLVGGEGNTFADGKRVLKKGGVFVSACDFAPKEDADHTFASVFVQAAKSLPEITKLIESGKYKSYVGKTYQGVAGALEALQDNKAGKAQGKLVVNIVSEKEE